MSLIKYDEKVARSISDQLNCTGITENAAFSRKKEKENYRPRTLVDETLEYIDPTPNIHTLFVQFNEKFFWNVLLPVQVKWSPRMTSCAGICSFHPRNRECVISLSNPLLKLRPRKDLIETLLHEMIHAYLFLTNDNRDRDGHGPVFQSHMKRINKEAGTNITIYHSFHNEVRLYQQHWWRCNGPCQKRNPYFGTVRRAMNRAPGPSDFWWAEHQATCGGQFIKVKEPEKPVKKGKEAKGRPNNNITASTVVQTPKSNGIMNWINKTDNSRNAQNSSIPKKPTFVPKTPTSLDRKSTFVPKTPTSPDRKSTSVPKIPNPSPLTSRNNIKSVSNVQTDMKKLGNSTNNVHGWGTGGPDSTSSSSSNSKSTNFTKNTDSRWSFSGTLGGSNTGRSILLDKFSNTVTNNVSLNISSINQKNSPKTSVFKQPAKNSNVHEQLQSTVVLRVTCPSCNKSVEESKINEHLDACLENAESTPSSSKKRKSDVDYPVPSKMFKDDNQIGNEKNIQSSSSNVDCPLCGKKLSPNDFNKHLENCLDGSFEDKDDDAISVHDSSSSSINLHDSPHHCLICDKKLEPTMSLNDHLEECVASVFHESDDESDNVFVPDTSQTETDKKEVLDSHPCPICMTLIKDSLMNKHLDNCLVKTN